MTEDDMNAGDLALMLTAIIKTGYESGKREVLEEIQRLSKHHSPYHDMEQDIVERNIREYVKKELDELNDST